MRPGRLRQRALQGWSGRHDWWFGEALLVAPWRRPGRTVLAAQLEAVGFRVVATSDASVGWRQLDSGWLRVAIADVSSGSMAGDGFFRRLLSERWPNRPVPLILLADAPLPGAIPGMVVARLPCSSRHVVVRAMRAAGVPEERMRESLRHAFAEDAPEITLSSRTRNDQTRTGHTQSDRARDVAR